ncbi:hypothetical protein [Burkholderia ubonensis]|nr:hypothetical protein [Burkholderia ubonensis]
MPAFIEPALAVLMQRPQASGARAYEIEFDGYRMQARLDAGDVPLFMHNGHDWTNQLPAAAPHPPAPA